LSYILKVLGFLLHTGIIVGSLTAGFPSQQMQSPDKSVPFVAAEASPYQSELIKFRITVRNTTDSVLYIPTVTIPSDIGPRARLLGILQLNEKEEWVNIGYNYDLPADTASRLRPHESQVFIELIENPLLVPSKKSGVPADKLSLAPTQGKFKVRLGYFRGLVQWQAHLKYITNYSGPHPHPEFVESAEFEIEGNPPKP
jgi:hypothetical protein